MSSQVISETCGITMYKGRGRFPSVLRLRGTLVLDKKPPVTLIILIMVDKAFYLVITTFNPAFGKPFGGPEKGFDPALWTRNLRLKPVSAHLQLPIHIHTHLKTVLPDLKPVRTPVAILGSLGVCIYVPASRHWLISYSPIHLT